MFTPNRNGFNNPEYESGGKGNHHQKCVCEICTCGKHHCPERSLKFEGETTNNYYYKGYNIVPESNSRVQYVPSQNHYDPHLIKSTYDSTYTPHKIAVEAPMNSRYEYQPSRGKFEDETEYKRNYVPNTIQADRPFQNLKYVPNNVKFEGSTTYQDVYRPYRLQTQKRCPTEDLPSMPRRCSPGKEHLHYSAQKNNWQ